MTDGPYKLPSGWRWVGIGEVAIVKYGKAKPKGDGEVPVVGSGGVYGSTSRALIGSPTIVIGRKGSAGSVVLFEQPCWPSDTTFFLEWSNVDLYPRFIFYALLNSPFSAERANTTLPTLQRQDVEGHLIPLPPLAEQRCIVARVEVLMERVREAKRLRCEARMNARNPLNAAIADAFSEIGSNRQPLLDVLLEKPRNGWSPRCDNASEGTPVLKLGAVLGFRFNPSAVKRTSLSVNLKAHYWLSNGDILISRSNTPELVAHAAVYSGEPTPCIYPDLLMRMRAEPSKADPQFIIYWLQSEETRSYIRAHAMGASSTMKKITQGDVCALPFPRIGVDDQRRIVAYLDSVQKQADALKRAQEDTDAELRRLEQAILDHAFRGEL
jgi:type I restriction enzyme, S subunit